MRFLGPPTSSTSYPTQRAEVQSHPVERSGMVLLRLLGSDLGKEICRLLGVLRRPHHHLLRVLGGGRGPLVEQLSASQRHFGHELVISPQLLGELASLLKDVLCLLELPCIPKESCSDETALPQHLGRHPLLLKLLQPLHVALGSFLVPAALQVSSFPPEAEEITLVLVIVQLVQHIQRAGQASPQPRPLPNALQHVGQLARRPPHVLVALVLVLEVLRQPQLSLPHVLRVAQVPSLHCEAEGGVDEPNEAFASHRQVSVERLLQLGPLLALAAL
mmetsp:Transcript_26988/g.88259  ORF Transcript_26988/g.88259 Transcript_26988/m.88259 type:complete len:275 (-) Transcript_26988:1399-2223(-)